ncbi:MAG: right-handed parallel beta-helix repeat-containing protein [Rhodospirillales bacterium]|nr:right-handed parallel beta-helix repeat-containing protein [Rhodospirillales bacterium]
MPTLQQLPLASIVYPTDEVPISQNGTTEIATVQTLLASTQPAMTLASGTLLGRVSVGPGGPEPVAVGAGLTIAAGALVANTTQIAAIASPAFTGTPTAPTPPAGDASNALATTAFVQAHTTQMTGVTITGDVIGTPSAPGIVAAVLPAITAPGSFPKVTVNAKGQVIGGAALAAGDVTGLDASGALVTRAGGSGRSLAARAADRVNVLDFGALGDGVTAAGVAINAAIAAAAAMPMGGEVYLPAGRYRLDLSTANIVLKSGVVLRGTGRGKTVLIADDSAGTGGTNGSNSAISNATAPGVFPALSDAHLTGLTLQGIRGQSGQNVTSGAFLVNLNTITNISVQDCECLDSRGMSLGLFNGADVLVRGCRVQRSNSDSIAVWDVSDAVITDNQISMSGDDSISAHTNDATAAPLRSGLVISNNLITDGPGIHVLGAKSVTITGNVIRRCRSAGVNVGFDAYFHQGNTPNFGVQISNNVIEDMIDSSGFIAGSTVAYYIWVGGSSRQAGSGAAAPGWPATGSGAVAPLYGTAAGNFYANGQTNTDGTHSVTGMTASPGGYWLRVEGNTLVRTLPAVANWSQWGYGAGLQVGVNGVYDGPISEAMLNKPGIHVIGALRNSRIAGNIIQTTGANGIEFDYAVADMDYDGVEISGNRIADFGQFGIFWPTSTVSNQRIVIRDNDFDADPFFRSTGRGPNGSWLTTGVGNCPLYLAWLSGAYVEGNHFRNAAVPVVQAGTVMNVLRRNVVHCAPVAVGYSAANQGVGTIPGAGADFTHVIEVCDPTNASFGHIASLTLATSAAQPTSGTYVAGHFVAASPPLEVAGQVLLGWQRLTTGASHVANVDWAAVYGAAPGAGSLAVSTTYVASGAIAASDTVALVSSATAVAMTLGAGGTDGHELIVKRFGAGTVSLTATIDGVAGTVINMNSSTIKESVTLDWSAPLATWLLL